MTIRRRMVSVGLALLGLWLHAVFCDWSISEFPQYRAILGFKPTECFFLEPTVDCYAFGLRAGAGTEVRTAILFGCIAPIVLLAVALAASMGTTVRLGHCRQCGYNLTGNTTGICPECGETIRVKRIV